MVKISAKLEIEANRAIIVIAAAAAVVVLVTGTWRHFRVASLVVTTNRMHRIIETTTTAECLFSA